MAKKQAIANESVSESTTARSVKPRAPRVKAVTHSKIATAETRSAVATADAALPPADELPSAQEEIARIAYGYWEARAGQDGSPTEDWFRAEQEYRNRLAAHN